MLRATPSLPSIFLLKISSSANFMFEEFALSDHTTERLCDFAVVSQGLSRCVEWSIVEAGQEITKYHRFQCA